MTKKELRQFIKNAIPKEKEVLYKESERICKSIIESEYYKNAELILAYMALSDEVDLALVIKNALETKKTVALPRIIAGTNQMEFYKISEDLINKSGAFTKDATFNIPEPPAKKENLLTPNELSSATLVLVPGRAFTKEGHRLGRGKGFYDLWLSKIPSDKKNRVHLAGVCFPQQIAESIPCDEHDIRMNAVIF